MIEEKSEQRTAQLNWYQRIFLLINLIIIVSYVFSLISFIIDAQLDGNEEFFYRTEVERYIPFLPGGSISSSFDVTNLIIDHGVTYLLNLLNIVGVALTWAKRRVGLYLLAVAIVAQNLFAGFMIEPLSGIGSSFFILIVMFILFGGKHWETFY